MLTVIIQLLSICNDNIHKKINFCQILFVVHASHTILAFLYIIIFYHADRGSSAYTIHLAVFSLIF